MKPEDIIAQLELTPKHLNQLLSWVDDDLARWKPKPDSWCINEVIGHLIWTDHHAFAERIKLMTEKKHVELPLIDVNKAALERQDALKTLKDVLQEFQARRKQSTDYLKTLDFSLLSNEASYKGKRWLAGDFFYEWPYHDYGHIAQIMRIQRAKLIPYMSATMQRALGH